MKKLLLATNNPAKIEEITLFLRDLPLTPVTLRDAGVLVQSPEEGRTFTENATTKAIFYMKHTGLPALADDGGVEIDALQGEPGVDSHRWVSKTHDDKDEDLIGYTLERMKNVPLGQRTAQMHVVLCLALPNGKTYTTEGIVRGVIAREPSPNRTAGFPFRSLFYLPEIQKYYDHLYLTPEETEKYNHRKQAIEAIKPIILEHVA